jgi:hypothetical protein
MKITFFTVLFMLLLSCNSTNKAKLTEEVKASIENKFDQQATATGTVYEIQSLDLTETEQNNYIGILETIENGESFTYELDVVVDGDSFVWKIIE